MRAWISVVRVSSSGAHAGGWVSGVREGEAEEDLEGSELIRLLRVGETGLAGDSATESNLSKIEREGVGVGPEADQPQSR